MWPSNPAIISRTNICGVDQARFFRIGDWNSGPLCFIALIRSNSRMSFKRKLELHYLLSLTSFDSLKMTKL
jgi:hypothetical protein